MSLHLFIQHEDYLIEVFMRDDFSPDQPFADELRVIEKIADLIVDSLNKSAVEEISGTSR